MEDAMVGRMEEGRPRPGGGVAMGVPLMEPRYPPRRKLTQFEKDFLRGLAVTLGIAMTVYIIAMKQVPAVWLKIFMWPPAMIGPVCTFACTFDDSSDKESGLR